MIRAILTDIEGTTSSLNFVKEVLFPYARARLADFVRDHGHESAVRRCLDETRALCKVDMTDDEAVRVLETWTDEDRKATPLKALQGMIWEQGFRAGHFTGHIYEDAARCLKAWRAQGLRLYVYSSGSAQAQKLYFAHSDFGDLSGLFQGFFDTTSGPKRDTASYRRIAAQIALPPGHILFLSDVKEELDAAAAAGMATRWLVRDGDIDGGAAHLQVASFDDIVIETPSSLA
ncbi:MAG TPA: acireductone synthase [Gammaproteobacteria bacterium]|nr:acireductone synthase [Gammaproteobacteria bacterium]